jgi:colanic acid/amylovoran biosynthesis glycosyltransferase
MKRIAYLLHNFPGITDTFIKREIRSLQNAGTEVRVISVWRPPDEQTTPVILLEWMSDTDFILPRSIFSIVFIFLKALICSPLRFLKAGLLALRTTRPGFRGFAYQCFYFVEAVLASDILRQHGIAHVHNHIGDQGGTVTMLAAMLADIEYSITFHGWPVFFDAKYSSIREKVMRAHFTRAISFFCQSQLMMLSECDDPALFKVVHCGLTMAKYKYRAPREKVETLFCAARLSPEKGLAFLIKAVKTLREHGHDINLRLAGNGPSAEKLKDLTTQLDIADKIKFLGFLDDDEIIRELQDADLFVLPSFVEGIPVSAMEAMAIGTPVIATNIAGTSELVEDGRTGILVRPSDSPALATAITRLVADYPLRLKIAAQARIKVEVEFDADKETKKLSAFLQQ